MVASKESPFLSNFNTLSEAIELRCLIERKSEGWSEKNATSEADIIPDTINNSTVMTISNTDEGSHPLNVIKSIIYYPNSD
jgi:hypothetical protein